ncbi:MAG: 3-dehydroquinate synthase II [Candidatus Hadarchaeales archaeon]
MSKLLWVIADWEGQWEEKKPFILSAIEAGADAVVVRPDEVEKVLKLGAINVVSTGESGGQSMVAIRSESISRDAVKKKLREIKRGGKKVALFLTVADKSGERMAAELGRMADFLVVATPGWKVIPLENLIAEFQKSKNMILAGVKNAEDAKVAVETLEIGTDGVALDPRDKGTREIAKVREVLDRCDFENLDLIPARVTLVKQVGSGDRACIDTTTIMEVGEGMLVGSQANGLFLVHSETLPSEFVEPRPFRVNAGAVHAYVLLPGGKTKYLSELKSGDEVLIVNRSGEGRPATVGRVKIERRPMVLVEAESKGETYRIMLQNAETVNLVSSDGSPISVSRLKRGDKVLLRVENAGRHFGTKVDEKLVER